jgi:hypothetical protein
MRREEMRKEVLDFTLQMGAVHINEVAEFVHRQQYDIGREYFPRNVRRLLDYDTESGMLSVTMEGLNYRARGYRAESQIYTFLNKPGRSRRGGAPLPPIRHGGRVMNIDHIEMAVAGFRFHGRERHDAPRRLPSAFDVQW